MPKFKELQFRIEGKYNDVDFTPTTIPLARLAEYLLDLATLLGNKESVHLIEVGEGSAAPLIYYDEQKEELIFQRLRTAKAGTGAPEAVKAYQNIDNRLKKDQGAAWIVERQKQAEVIEFPGSRKETEGSYGPIRERATLVGRVRRVGGRGETIPIWLERADGKMLYCETNETLSKSLSDFYLEPVRVHGVAIWTRSSEGEWKLGKFTIQSFDPESLSEEDLLSTLAKLKNIEGNGWNEVKDPLAELRRIRHGEDDKG